jgi:hypothetical protein
MSTANPDAELVARGERFEKFLLEYMDAWLEWAPLMRAARAQVGDDISVLITAIERTGCDAAQARMSELERDMQPLAEEIIAAPATSLAGCALRRSWLSGRHFRPTLFITAHLNFGTTARPHGRCSMRLPA